MKDVVTKFYVFVFFFLGLSFTEAIAQKRNVTRNRILAGLSTPELFHVGISRDLSTTSQLGLDAGIFYATGTTWPSVSLEHRLYLGKVDEVMERKKWFFRQSASWFPEGDDVAATLSVGLDLKSRNNYKGWTIDVGISRLFSERGSQDPSYLSETYNRFVPAVRVQHFMYLSKRK